MSKLEDLNKFMSEINKNNETKHKVIQTDIKSIDYILGGGIELGSKIQFVAESSIGKSTIALQISKNFCKKGLNVLYVDTENSISKEMLESTGCIDYYNKGESDFGELVLLKESDFDTVGRSLDICFKSEHFSLIIIDSLASLVSNCYTDLSSQKNVKSLVNNNTNFESRPINLFINKYSSLANKYNVAILYINQYRNKVDPFKGTILKEFGNKIVRYNSDVIIKIKKIEDVWQSDDYMFSDSKEKNKDRPSTYAELCFSLDKSNKMLTGNKVCTFIRYGFGISEFLDNIVDEVRTGKIVQNGECFHPVDENENYDGFIKLVNHFVIKSLEKNSD